MEKVLVPSTGFELAAVCHKTSSLVEEARANQPDLLLLDLAPDLTFGVLLEIQRQLAGTRIVLWVRSISTELAYQSIEHGVRGILRRTHPPEVPAEVPPDGSRRRVVWFEETLKASFTSIANHLADATGESQLVSLAEPGFEKQGNCGDIVHLGRHRQGVSFETIPEARRQRPLRVGIVRA
jgi:DNA-binding NarL/FixJ family response regulator